MVPLTVSSTLVVESHRSEGYGARAAPLGNGVVVYVVDTAKDNDRSGETGVGVALDRFASYLVPSLSDSERSERAPSSRARRDPFLILGESITYDGITISVVQSGVNDLVRITRTSPPTITVAPTTTVPAVTETAGVQDGIFATCGSFLTPNDAQTWFDANPDFGESVDGNGDGPACGDGDFGGATDCGGRAPELVLPQFCDQYN